MKSNRQIGLDGGLFLSDCLNDGIFFVYSLILSGLLSAAGDIMKLLGQSSRGMDALTNGVVLLDLACSLGMVVVAYYIYFMHCGESVPKLGVKPLLYLEYIRLAYYGLLMYVVLYRFFHETRQRDVYSLAMPIFYVVYLAWLVTCTFAAMFILTVLHQNMIRRSYAQSFKILSLAGLGINIVLPLVYFVTRFWVRGWGDGFYSAGLCDFVRFGLAPMFYAAIWFLFMNAIDRVDKVFGEVDNAIRDKRYRIELDENESGEKPKSTAKPKAKNSAPSSKGKKGRGKGKGRGKKSAKAKAAAKANQQAEAKSDRAAASPLPTDKLSSDEPASNEPMERPSADSHTEAGDTDTVGTVDTGGFVIVDEAANGSGYQPVETEDSMVVVLPEGIAEESSDKEDTSPM